MSLAGAHFQLFSGVQQQKCQPNFLIQTNVQEGRRQNAWVEMYVGFQMTAKKTTSHFNIFLDWIKEGYVVGKPLSIRYSVSAHSLQYDHISLIWANPEKKISTRNILS